MANAPALDPMERNRSADTIPRFTIREGLEVEHLPDGIVRVWIRIRHGLSFGWVPLDLSRDEVFTFLHSVTWVPPLRPREG